MSDELQQVTQRAAEHGRTGSYGPEAVALNTRILELDSENADALFRLARCHSECANWLGAHECYQQLATLVLDPADVARVRDAVEATRSRAAEQGEMNRRTDEQAKEQTVREEARRQQLAEEVQAIDNFTEARTLAIGARDAHLFDLAFLYHDRALVLARKREDLVGALAAQASTLRRSGRPTDALAALRRSIELEPSREHNKASYTALVATLRVLERLEEARDEGEALLEIFPDDWRLLFALGRLFKELFARDHSTTDLDRSAAFYRRASELQPGDRDILAELRRLVGSYDHLAELLGGGHAPVLGEKARELERHIARLERQFAVAPPPL